MEAAQRGAKALEDGKADEAVKEYTSALSQNPQAVTYYIQRSIAYARSKPPQHEPALKDVETAVMLAHKRAKSELISQAQLRRAISLYSLGRFADCQACLGWSEKRNPKEKSIPIWRMKVEDKLNALPDGDENAKATVIEVPVVEIDAGKTKAAASSARASKAASTSTAAAETPTASTATAAAAAPAFTPPSKIRHDWYQSTETVTVSLMAKGVPKDKATVELQAGSISISYPLPSGSDYDFSLEPLFARIIPEESTYKIMSTKVDFVLKKAGPGKWATLEGKEPIQPSTEGKAGDDESEAMRKLAANQPTTATGAPSYPTSSRSGPKNWDKLAADLTKKKEKKKTDEEKKDGGNDDDDDDNDDDDDFDYDDEGGDEVNGFFKKLYKGADADTQRAMMKSYVESNGTALSTNWSEVSQKQYETQPPDGMEAKKW